MIVGLRDDKLRLTTIDLTSYKIVKMSVMSSEIDRVARTWVVIECNGMGIMLMSVYAASGTCERRL